MDTQAELISRLKEVRGAALEHARIAQALARERRQLIEALMAEGVAQADIARELGVSRQAIQKMVEGRYREVAAMRGKRDRRPLEGARAGQDRLLGAALGLPLVADLSSGQRPVI